MSRWHEPVILTGEHVTLRPLARADRAALLDAFADGLAGSFATVVPGPDTIDGWYNGLEAEAAVGRALPFTVFDRDGRVSGATRFLRMNEAHRRVDIGGTLYAKRVQRTALNTEAKRLPLAQAFEMLDCQCVQLRTNFHNRRSRAAIERLGARQDGVLRGHMITAEGEARDTVVYSILAHEWPQVRRNLDQLLAAHGDPE